MSLLITKSDVGKGEVAKLQVVLLVFNDFLKTGHFIVRVCLVWVFMYYSLGRKATIAE